MSDNHLQNLRQPEKFSVKQLKAYFQGSWFSRPKRLILYVRAKFSHLNLSQWMYLFAIILLLAQEEQDLQEMSNLMLIGAVAGVGLLRELWHVFNRIWDNMLGKGLVLVLYAATANFALAISALKINEITGVEPTPFVFTLGFATLIMLPFWFLVSSVVFFSVALVAGSLWSIIGVLLRPLRIKVKIHWEDKEFVFITMILRLVLIPYVIASIVTMALPYAKQIELFASEMAIFKQEVADDNNDAAQNEDKTVVSESESQNVRLTINNRPFEEILGDEEQIKWLDKLIAGFIYHFETYPKSACKKAAGQRSLPIDENLILLAREDDSELGYHYSVGPCVGNYTIEDEALEPSS